MADGGLRVAEAWPEAALRLVPSETSAWAVPGTRTLARMPVLRFARPASALALVPEPRQLPTSPDRTRPSAQTLTSAEVGRPRRAETSAATS